MSSKKKRNKVYKGSVAAVRPTITKVSAVKRHPAHQWLVDHKKFARPALIIAGIAFVVILITIGIISVIWPR